MWPRLLIHWGLVHPGLAYCRNHPSQMFFSVLLPLPKPSSSYFWLSLWFPPERMRTGLSYSQLRIAAKKRNLTICRFAYPLKLLSLLKLRYRILLILGYHINQESCHQSCGRFFFGPRHWSLRHSQHFLALLQSMPFFSTSSSVLQSWRSSGETSFGRNGLIGVPSGNLT